MVTHLTRMAPRPGCQLVTRGRPWTYPRLESPKPSIAIQSTTEPLPHPLESVAVDTERCQTSFPLRPAGSWGPGSRDGIWLAGHWEPRSLRRLTVPVSAPTLQSVLADPALTRARSSARQAHHASGWDRTGVRYHGRRKAQRRFTRDWLRPYLARLIPVASFDCVA